MSASDTFSPGERLTERYTLTRFLGRGGMATVWEAVTDRDQRVAIKVMSSQYLDNQDLIARFFLEARNAARVSHPGIVRVFDTGQTSANVPFLVMELLEGLSLAEFFERNGPMTAAQANGVLAPVLDAVGAAHAAGIVHRDLKPANIFIALGTQPAVKVLDFGISRALTNDTRLTQTGMMFGTPGFMSPEQIRGEKDLGPASDVYSVGAIAFELLSGERAFDGDNPLLIAAKVINEPAPSLEARRPDVLKAISKVVDRALQKDTASRPASALDFRRELIAVAAPDTAWVFERALELKKQGGASVPPALGATFVRQERPVSVERVPLAASAELPLTQVTERLRLAGQPLPVPVAAFIVHELLLDATTPTVVGPQQVRVSSHGSVRAVGTAPRRSVRGTYVASFAAPETQSGHAGILSLQFSLGAVLVWLLTGEEPFTAATEALLLVRLKAGAGPQVLARLPASLQPVVQRMLEADPEHRYPDSGACARALAGSFESEPLFARAASELAAAYRFAQAAPAVHVERLAAATSRGEASQSKPIAASPNRGLALLVALLVLGGVVTWRVQRAKDEAVAVVDEPVSEGAPDAGEAVGDELVGLVEVESPRPVKTSEYEVKSHPRGAALWLDGEFRGNAPGVLTLTARKVTLRFELPGHRAEERVLEPDGVPHVVGVKLTTDRDMGLVRFDIADDARVWLDGVLAAQGAIELPVEANVDHQVELEAKGRRSPAQVVRVGLAETKVLRAP